MAKLFRRVRYLLRQGGMERELAREIEHHRELTRLRLEREGRPAQGAVDRSARILGNVSLAREDARAVWLAPWLEGTWQDLQYAMRSARREPAFAALVMLTLGITIGLNASVFTAFNGILVRPWPVRDPGSVVTIADAATRSDFSLVEYQYLAEHARSFSGLDRHALHRRYQRGMRDRSRGGARQSPARHRKLLRCARRRHRAWPWTARQRRPPGCTRSGRRHQLRCLASALRSGSRDRRPSHSPGTRSPSPSSVSLPPHSLEPPSIWKDIWVPMSAVARLRPGNAGVRERFASLKHSAIALGGRLMPGVPRAQAQAEMELLNRRFRLQSSLEDHVRPSHGHDVLQQPLQAEGNRFRVRHAVPGRPARPDAGVCECRKSAHRPRRGPQARSGGEARLGRRALAPRAPTAHGKA